jgi:hypothetical protein
MWFRNELSSLAVVSLYTVSQTASQLRSVSTSTERTHGRQNPQAPPRPAVRVAGNVGRFIRWAGTLLVTATSSMQFFMLTPDSFLKDTALFVWMAPVDPLLPDLLPSLSLSWQGRAVTCPNKPQVVRVQLQAILQHWGGAGCLQCCHSLTEVTTIVLLHSSLELRMSCLFVTRSPVITFSETRFVWLKWVLIRCGILQLSMMLWVGVTPHFSRENSASIFRTEGIDYSDQSSCFFFPPFTLRMQTNPIGETPYLHEW